MVQDAEVISIETVKHHKWLTFEDCLRIPIWKEMPFTTRLLRYFLIIHTHWAIKVVYYVIFSGVTSSALAIDVTVILVKKACVLGKWLAIKLYKLAIFVYKWLMDIAGESIKAFLKSLLRWLGIAAAIYATYVFIKSGWYLKIFDLL